MSLTSRDINASSGRGRPLRCAASVVLPKGCTEPNGARVNRCLEEVSDDFQPRTFSTEYLPSALSFDPSPSRDTVNYTHRTFPNSLSRKRRDSDELMCFTSADYSHSPLHPALRTPNRKSRAQHEVYETSCDPQFASNPCQPRDKEKHREATKVETMLQVMVDGVATISLNGGKREEDKSPFDAEFELATAPRGVQGFSRLVQDYLYSGESENAPNLKDVAFQLMKEALLDQFMEKFWRILDENWNRNVRTHGSGTSPSQSRPFSPNSQPPTGSTDKTSRSGRKRSWEGAGSDEEVPSGGDDRGNSKRSGKGKTKRKGDSRPFACPFRKQNPIKYNLHDWNTCATSSWEEIPRLKEHLFRAHKITQCERCFTEFPGRDELTAHRRSPVSCELQEGKMSFGITYEIEVQLRRRDTLGLPHEQWRNIWKILFPDELPHSNPYFEQIHDNIAMPVSLDECERYMRKNLPRVFKFHLGHAIEERLREFENYSNLDILSIIRSCHDRLISEYRSGQFIDGGSQSVLHMEATRGQTTVFGGLTAPNTPPRVEIPQAMPGVGIQPTPPDSGTRPARDLQRVGLDQEAGTPSKPPKNSSTSNPQQMPYMDDMYSNLDFGSTGICCCPPGAGFCTCPGGFSFQHSSGNSAMSNSMMGMASNPAMGNSTMDNTIMYNTTMGNSPMDNAPMGSSIMGDSGLEAEPSQPAFCPYGYTNPSNAQ